MPQRFLLEPESLDKGRLRLGLPIHLARLPILSAKTPLANRRLIWFPVSPSQAL